MPTRITDQRTRRPVDYSSLLEAAIRRADETGEPVPAACRAIAKEASSEQWDSIERQLRRIRRDRESRSPATSAGHEALDPTPGFGVWARDLQGYATRLESELTEIQNRQEYSAHRIRQLRDRASKVHDLASQRLDYLQAFGRERAIETLRPQLGGLGDLDSSMDTATFYDGEVRAMTVTLYVTSRVLQETSSALEFLGD